MNRRQHLGTAGVGLVGSLAGCSGGQTDGPEPAASELRLRIENTSEHPQSAMFLLRTTRDDVSTVRGFELSEIQPGETRRREPELLDPGSYTLKTELTTLSMGTETSWVGHDCPVKDIEIELRPEGFRIRNECLDE